MADVRLIGVKTLKLKINKIDKYLLTWSIYHGDRTKIWYWPEKEIYSDRKHPSKQTSEPLTLNVNLT